MFESFPPMRRHLPTFTSLLCFEASARHLSFTRAAEELNLTQSAVSRQVRNLEEFLQTDLFFRVKKRLSLTTEGKSYAQTVNEHLNSLEAETLKLITKDEEDVALNLGTFPTFGSRWLIPKLADFTAKHPELHFNLTTSILPFDFEKQDIDVAIQHGDGNWPEVDAQKIVTESVVAACSPELIAKEDSLNAETVLKYTFLHLKTRSYAWPEWLSAHGIESTASTVGPTFENFSMMIRAARSGLGIAIVPRMFIEEELREGRLIAPFGQEIESKRGYYLVHDPLKGKLDKVQKFRAWIDQYRENPAS